MQRITALRPLFPRNSFLVVNGKTINDENNGGLKFQAEIKSGNDKKIGVGRFYIYNLSQDIAVGSEVKLNFGYADDVGEYGIYEVIKTNKYRDGGDIVKELLCSERSKSTSKIISLSIDGNVRISDALKKVCQSAGINIINMELLNDKIYTNGYTCYNKAFQEIKELVEDAESKMILKSNDLYIYHKELKEKIISLSFGSGLIENPTFSEKLVNESEIDVASDNKEGNVEWTSKKPQLTATTTKEYDYNIKCFPIHYIKKGDTVNIVSDTFTGLAQVREIEINLKDSWIMNLKVKVL